MYFDSLMDFFAMGGYGFYVWLAYGLSFMVLLVVGVQSYRAKQQVLAEVNKQQQREQRLQTMKQGQQL